MGQALSGLQVEVYTASQRPQAADVAAPRAPQRHRCDGRVEDLCRALAAGWGELRANTPAAWANLLECYKAEPG
jgi:hypothetical protein